MSEDSPDTGIGPLAAYYMGRWSAESSAQIGRIYDAANGNHPNALRRRISQLEDALAKAQAAFNREADYATRLKEWADNLEADYNNLREWAKRAEAEIAGLRRILGNLGHT